MSTYWGYKCLDCDKNSEHELNHGEETLRRLVKHEKALNDALEDVMLLEIKIMGAIDELSPLDFLRLHRGHRIVLENEYGDIKEISS